MLSGTKLYNHYSHKKNIKNLLKKIISLDETVSVSVVGSFAENKNILNIGDLDLVIISNLISKRIAMGSGTAFLVAQLIDVHIFDKLRKKVWFIAPLASSLIGSTIDTFLFFLISFYGTEMNWIALSFGDLSVKIFVALVALVPFRLLLYNIREISEVNNKISVQ